MDEESLILPLDALESQLLPRLVGRVFHVTTPEAYTRILSDRFIKSNKAGDFPFTWEKSESSYFRKRGCVCVFDLRSATREQVNDGLLKCPPWSNNQVVFLLLKESCYQRLIPWTIAKSDVGFREMYVPYVEVGYPDAISLDDVERVLLVDVEEPPEPEPCPECLELIVSEREIAKDWRCGSCGAEGRPKVPFSFMRKFRRPTSTRKREV
jgi:hypothetical protein